MHACLMNLACVLPFYYDPIHFKSKTNQVKLHTVAIVIANMQIVLWYS